MNFHSAHTDVKLVSNEFVGQTSDHQAHHITFALSELIEARNQPCTLLMNRQPLLRQGQGLLHPVYQGIVRERLLDRKSTRLNSSH